MKFFNAIIQKIQKIQSQIYSDHHRNWLLTIAHFKLPIVLFGACAITLVVTLPTFLFDPVYEAKTIITLDADLSKMIKSVDISYPYTTGTDYIRYEYFATHSVTLMHAPKLADQFVKRWNIMNRFGKVMFPEYFIKPNLFRLLFSNNGQGIKAQWVSDTQQFIIAGYSKNPDTAVAYSRDYTESFLKENANNPTSAMNIILERLDNQISEISRQRDSVDAQIQQVKKRYRIGDVAIENQSLINKIYSIKSDLDSARFDEKAYKLRIDKLYRQSSNHEALKKYQIIMESNPTIVTLKTRIQELTRTLAGLSVELTKEHPNYKVQEKTLEAAKEALKKEAEKTFYQQIDRRSDVFESILSTMLRYDLNHMIYRYQVEHYNSLLKSSESRLEYLGTAQLELNKLNDQRSQLSNLLSNSLTNHSNVSNVMKKPVPFFRVVSPANINKSKLKYYKYFPKRKLILALTFLASLLALSFLVIAKELYDNTFYVGWQVSALKNRLVYSDVPILEIAATNQKSDFDTVICKHIHEICLSANDAQIVRVTSATEGEGKTTIARAMALYNHKMGKSVVLIDGDLMHRSSSIRFGFNDHPGLMDYICGQKASEDIIIRNQINNISFIPAGIQDNLDLKPFVLKPLTDLFSILTADYDKIIFIDEPLSDFHFMLADMLPPHDIIIVVKSGEHSIYKIDRMTGMQEFTEGKATFKGIVINKRIM